MKGVKLTYFESKGRAELARIILAYGGVRYTMFIGMSFGQGRADQNYTCLRRVRHVSRGLAYRWS